jgi:hypothetical protein
MVSENTPLLPQEGGLLFEDKGIRKTHKLGIISLIGFLFFFILLLKDLINWEFYPLQILYLVLVLGFFYVSKAYIVLLYFGFKDGFKDETYEGFYFSDRIIFYRISNYANNLYTEGKTKEELLKEIIKLKNDELGNLVKIHFYEKGVKILDSKIPYKHKSEVMFGDVKYFLSEQDKIKVVEIDQQDENELNRFYNELSLAPKYEKNISVIVEYLNSKVKEAKMKSENKSAS